MTGPLDVSFRLCLSRQPLLCAVTRHLSSGAAPTTGINRILPRESPVRYPHSSIVSLDHIFFSHWADISWVAVGPLFSILPSCPSSSSTKASTLEGVTSGVEEARLSGVRHLRKRLPGYCGKMRLRRRELIQSGHTQTVLPCHVRRAGAEAPGEPATRYHVSWTR